MRVLYVEDNPTNVFLVKRVAKLGTHEIINYVDGSEALRKYDDINPDLVLMDVQLSGELNGLDVVRQLRARGVDTPIIAVTAYAMVGDKERCIEAGCTDYLAKPLPVPRLVEIFQEYSDAAEAKKAQAASTGKTTDGEVAETPVDASVDTTEETTSAATTAKTTVDVNTDTTPTATTTVGDIKAEATTGIADDKTETTDDKSEVVADATKSESTTDGTEKKIEPTVVTSNPDTTEVSDKS